MLTTSIRLSGEKVRIPLEVAPVKITQLYFPYWSVKGQPTSRRSPIFTHTCTSQIFEFDVYPEEPVK